MTSDERTSDEQATRWSDGAAMRVIAALGGNALLHRGERPEAVRQRRNLDVAVTALAEIARKHEVVVTHGNGPQVGLLALQSRALGDRHPDPLDVLGAESEGMIGYLLEQELRNRLPNRSCATLLTQVVVAADDPAFEAPTKAIGPHYAPDDAERLSRQLGWRFTPGGTARRRVVASPQPLGFVERSAIELLVDAGVIVVCAGGGGIPVVDDDGALRGVEAVVDKDRSAALLARELRADVLLLLTDAVGVFVNWGTPEAKLVRRAHPDALRELTFETGTMGPKVEAATGFAATGMGYAAIGAVEDATDVLLGKKGTTIRTDVDGLELVPLD
jgi:carbamate kinase